MRSLIKFVLFVVLVVWCVRMAGQAIESAQESNRQIMDQIGETH